MNTQAKYEQDFKAAIAMGAWLKTRTVVHLEPPIDPAVIAIRGDPSLAKAFNGIGLEPNTYEEAWIQVERGVSRSVVRLHVPIGAVERGKELLPVIKGALERAGLKLVFCDLLKTGNGSRFDGWEFVARVAE